MDHPAGHIPSATIMTTDNDTIITSLRFTYVWRDTFDDIGIGPTGKKSPTFSSDADVSRTRWTIRMYPGESTGDDQHVNVFLFCESSKKSEVRAKFKFQATSDYSNTVTTSPEMEEHHVFRHYNRVASTDGPDSFCFVLQNNAGYGFEIHCDIEMRLDDIRITNQDAGEPFAVPGGTLLDDFVSLYTSGKHADFTIHVGAAAFPVHKAVLSVRSPALAKMFEHGTEEKREECCNLTDTTSEAFNELLRFIYTDEVIGIDKIACDLLALAEKYDLGRLKVMCEEALRRNLSIENSVNTLIYADLHRADQLKKRTIDFINCHTLAVMQTPDFPEIAKSHHLMSAILSALATKGNLR